jgi:hypothetical protein
VLTVLALRYAHQEAAGRLDRTLDIYLRTQLRRDQRLTGALITLVYLPRAAIVLAAVAGAAGLARRWSGVILSLSAAR